MKVESRFLIPEWPAPKNIKAMTSFRSLGVSRPPFEGFNLATHVGDEPLSVRANRFELKQLLNLPSEPLWLDQTHSCTVIDAQNHPTKMPADASYTNQQDIVTAVLTADCLPLLLCDTKGSVVAAIHAGWRGLCDGIIEKLVTKLPVDPKNLMAWLGPAIGPEAFEVGQEVYAEFGDLHEASKACFKQTKQDKWLADIYKLATVRLNACGVTKIYGGTECTYTNKQKYFSYRRNHTTGRMVSLIWMESNK